eukprot:scaffold19258_cov67-Cyclotella_meneghiniana.AAC.2
MPTIQGKQAKAIQDKLGHSYTFIHETIVYFTCSHQCTMIENDRTIRQGGSYEKHCNLNIMHLIIHKHAASNSYF